MNKPTQTKSAPGDERATTSDKMPPNPAAERSLIINGLGYRLWDYERATWATPVVIAVDGRRGTTLLGLNERAGALIEIREAL